MKDFVISDIHGSLKYAKLALEAYRASGASRLICLGDFYYHGPRNPLPEGYDPMGVSKLLNPLKDEIDAIRGNCDAEVDEYISAFPFHPSLFMRIPSLSGHKLTLAFIHGHHPLTDVRGLTAVISGHTHIAVLEKKDGVIYANPGSVSLPKAPASRNCLIIDNRGVSMYDLETGQLLKTLAFE
jgi:putative phosphoesterase